jgi:hypothetical protein
MFNHNEKIMYYTLQGEFQAQVSARTPALAKEAVAAAGVCHRMLMESIQLDFRAAYGRY